MQLRDVGNTTGVNQIPVSFREDFYWNRKLETQWKLTKNLNLTFESGTNARIEAPHEQVNKLLNPDKYEVWKDSVLMSLRDLGNPMEYRQIFKGTYNLPFSVIPVLDFIDKGNLRYDADYSWDRGAVLADADVNLGNTIKSNRTIGLEGLSFNLLKLYNKIPFLDEANKKYGKKSGSDRNLQRNNQRNQTQKEKTAAKKRYADDVLLNTDSAIVVQHNLNTKRFRLTAKTAQGKSYQVKYKIIDNNTIKIKNLDTVVLKLTVSPLPPLSDEN